MEASNAWTSQGAIDYTRRFDEYKETVRQVFPNLPRGYVDNLMISRVDALALTYFLHCYPRKVLVLDIGTLASVSALHFASQPKVLRVISVGPNPTIADEVDSKLATPGHSIDPEPLENLRVLDVAQAVLAKFDDEKQKIDLLAGTVVNTEGNSQVSIQESSLAGSEKLTISASELADGVSLVAFVDGVHTKEQVQATLEAIFEMNPRAVAILNGCRGSWGPFVQAGVVRFMEETQRKYHFQLFGDLGPSVATSGLGIVYSDPDAAEAKQTLVKFSELFSERLDPLRLLRREEELISAVNWHKNEAERHKNEARRLKKRNARLVAQNSSQQQVTEASAEGALRAPGIKQMVGSKLLRRLGL